MFYSLQIRSSWVLAVCCLLSPAIARADLMISNAPGMAFTTSVNTTDRHSPAFHGSIQFDPINSLHQSNTLTSAFASGGYSLSQVGGLADFILSGNLSAPAISSSFNNHGMPQNFPVGSTMGMSVQFTPTVDETYALWQSWNEDGLATVASTSISLFDLTTNTSLYYYNDYRDNVFGMTDFQNTGDAIGALLAGHVYQLAQVSILANYSVTATTLGTASSSLEFIAAPPGGNPFTADFSPTVPEPSSFALMGLGTIGLAVGCFRRRAASKA